MTFQQLQANEEFTSWWRKVINSTNGKMLMQMIKEDSHPMYTIDDRTRFSHEAMAHRTGFNDGYNLLVQRMMMLVAYVPMNTELPEARFEPIIGKEL